MRPLAYYNEIDKGAAQWLRELIHEGYLPAGDVDDRSIADVRPGDLEGYGQCHFFAGIGGWPYALRLAGWPEDVPIWTGSPPCQPFSTAGQKRGFADERHLWPHFARLIRERRPAIVLGEQVASQDGLAWFDAVRADLEGADYASGAADLCAAGVGAPHIRQRLYWCAVALGGGLRLAHPGLRGGGRQDVRTAGGQLQADGGRCPGGMAHGAGDGLQDRDFEGEGGRRLPGEPRVLDAAVRLDGGRGIVRSEGAAGEGRPGRSVREDAVAPGGVAHSRDGSGDVPGTEGRGEAAAHADRGRPAGVVDGGGEAGGESVRAAVPEGGRPGAGASRRGMEVSDFHGRDRERHPGEGSGEEGRSAAADGAEPAGGMADSDVEGRQGRFLGPADQERPSEVDGSRSVGEPCGMENAAGGRFARTDPGAFGGKGVRDAQSEGADEVRGVVLAEGLGRRGGSEGDMAGLPGQLQARRLCHGCGMEHACGDGCQGGLCGRPDAEREALLGPSGPDCAALRNPWSYQDWLYCRDGKYRPALPVVFPLVDGFSERVGLLRGYGNAIVAPLAAVFVEAVMDYLRSEAYACLR